MDTLLGHTAIASILIGQSSLRKRKTSQSDQSTNALAGFPASKDKNREFSRFWILDIDKDAKNPCDTQVLTRIP
jgi:hypothetical protein